MTDEELIARLREIQGQAGLFASAAADRVEAQLKAELRRVEAEAEALLPCPFCGGEARKWQDPSHSAAWFIGCDDGETDCFGSIHWAETEAETIAAWNRRAALPTRGVGDAYEAGLQTALGLIGSIGYGKNEDVDRGHEEAFSAVAKHLQDLRDAKSAALATEKPVTEYGRKVAQMREDFPNGI